MAKKSRKQLFLLGKIRIQDGNGRQDQFSSHRAVGLLVYLVSVGQAVPRSELVELFWPDKPADRGSANLRWALNYLKKILPDCLDASRQTIRFDPEGPVWVDIYALRQGLATGDTAVLEAAIGAAQGEFCRGFYFDESPEFETWLLTRREYWREQLSTGWQQLISHYTSGGEYSEALRLARRLLELDSWQESAHRQLMLLLARTGDLNGALAQFQHCRRLLIDELGVEPQPETLTLHERLRALRSAPPPPLPAQPTPFIGREESLLKIEAALADPETRLVTLVGMGGIGKTRLALAAAERLREAFLEGVYFVPLAAVTERNGLYLALAQSLNLQLRGESRVEEQVVDSLRGKEVLLVLDNFEQLTQAAQGLEPLLQQAPALRFLVTSRERLNLRWERPFPLRGLSFPQTPDDPDWQTTSSVRLFEQAAARACPGFELSLKDREAVSEICRLVEGFPLALELAAAGLRFQSPHGLLAQIREDLDTLSTGLRDVPQRQRSLRAIFDAAYSQLSPEIQATFCWLSLFENSFTAAAVRQIAQAPVQHLQTLVDSALLAPVPDNPGGVPRFTLHPLLRQYAAQKRDGYAPEIQAEVAARQAAYYLEQLITAEMRLRQGEDVEALLHTLFQDLGNIHVAWRWAVAQAAFAQLTEALPGLLRYYEMRGPFEEGVLLFRETHTTLTHKDLPEVGQTLLLTLYEAESQLLANSGRYQQAAEVAQVGLNLAASISHAVFEAKLQLAIGTAHYGMGQAADAKRYGEMALAAAQTLADEPLVASCLQLLGTLNLIQGNYSDAHALYQQAEAGHSAAHNLLAASTVRHNLALIDFHQGNTEVAQTLFQNVLEDFRKTGNRRGISATLHNLGLIAQYAGRLTEAREYMSEALALRRGLGDLSGEAFTLANLAYISKESGQIRLADEQASEALGIALQLSDRRTELYTRNILGIIAVEHGRYSNGWQHFEQNLALSHTLESGGDEARARKGLGWTALRVGQFAAAEEHLLRGLALVNQEDVYSERQWLEGNLAELYLLSERLDEADAQLRALEVQPPDNPQSSLHGYVLKLRAEQLRLSQNFAGVEEVFKQVVDIWGELDPLVDLRTTLAASYLEFDQPEAALSQIEQILPVLADNPDGLGIDDPEWVYLICYQGLAAVGDERAAEMLAHGHGLLQRRALRIRDAGQRESYLQNLASHRALLEAWRNGR